MHHHQNSQTGDKFVELHKKYLSKQREHYYIAKVYLYLLHSVIEQIKGALYPLSPQAAVNRTLIGEYLARFLVLAQSQLSKRTSVTCYHTHNLFCLFSGLKTGDLLKCSMLWPWVVREFSAVSV